jgi:hypothetical protein
MNTVAIWDANPYSSVVCFQKRYRQQAPLKRVKPYTEPGLCSRYTKTPTPTPS